ncbi:MAG TPA: YbaN family protein [Anaerolineales bacterium]|nr:YbaN family protein [Anaerolineales bacterium]
MGQLVRWVFVVLGTLSVALGVIGVFVPVLPTTPFLLLAAFFYARSSDKFLDWLLNNRVLGAYVRNYREHRGMLAQDKLLTILALWLGIGLSGYLAVASPAGRLALLAIAAAVTWHLLRIRTLRPPLPKTPQEPAGVPAPVDQD